MSEPGKKRGGFQFHLSTAIVMIFVASGCVFVNLGQSRLRPGGPSGEFEVFGFPMEFEKYYHYDIDSGAMNESSWQNDNNELLIAVCLNILTALTFVSLIAINCEWTIAQRINADSR